MKAHKFFKFTSATIVILAGAAIPAFAQHGGGGHGGGGGGFHGGGGGGFHSGGGGFSGGSFRGGASSAPRGGANFSRGMSRPPVAGYSGGNANRSYSAPANGSQRGSAFSSAPRATADGQWHSFSGGSAAGAGSASAARGSASTGGGWQVSGGNRSASAGTTAGGTRTVRSFSGQGSDVWENAPASRNVVSKSSALSNIRGSFASSTTRNSTLGSNSSLVASSRLAPGASFGNSLRSNTFGGVGGGFRFGHPVGRFRGGLGFGGGCWNCGFGFGFGFGWWPGWGLGFGWPGLYWNDPWLWGWPGYGYYGYPSGYIYGDPYAGNYNYSNPAPTEDYPDADSGAPPAYQGWDQGSSQGSSQSSAQTAGAANTTVPVLLYMKDGSVYSVRDYWVAGGQIHYVLLSGAESAIDMEQLDVQRTVDENAKSGVQFTLKPSPSSFAPFPRTPAQPQPAPRMNLTTAPPVKS
jgi:hypothetical protein